MPYPIPADDAARLAALRECEILDTEPEALFDDLATLAAKVCETPIALVSLVDETRQWLKCRIGCEFRETPRDDAFCSHAILSNSPLVVPDATHDPRFRANPLVAGDTGIRFYAGVPLVLRDGFRVGTLCVIDKAPRTLTSEQLQTLAVLARQVSSLLEQRRRIRELNIANEQLLLARAEAEKANRSRAKFLECIGQEIRTPMTAILGFSDLLCDPTLTGAERREYHQIVRRSGKQLIDAINGILDINRVFSPSTPISRVECELEPTIRSAVDSLASLAAGRACELQVAIAQDLPTIAITDPELVRQIVLQVVGTAILNAEGERIRVSVNAGEATPQGDLEIKVAMQTQTPSDPASRLADALRPGIRQGTVATSEWAPDVSGLASARTCCQALGGELITSADATGTRCEATLMVGVFQPSETVPELIAN